jgi:predicted PurR-regulated permease PerM
MNGDDEVSSTTFLRILLVIFGTITVLLVLPFLQAVLAGGLLAYLVAPVSDRLARRLGPTVGALVTILATVLVFLVPLLVILAIAVRQAVSIAQEMDIPDIVAVENFLGTRLGTPVDLSVLEGPLSSAVETGLRGLLGSIVVLLGGIPGFLISTVVFLFAFFYLLRDGDQLVSWTRTVVPLDPPVMDELIRRTDDLVWAAVVGNVIVAGVQAVLTVIGFIVLGFNNIVLLGVATFILSLLPLIGASVVWVPAVIYLLLEGRIPEAVGLFVYGSLVISTSDNFIRPMAMKRGAKLNPGLLVLGIFGGVALFGFIGLFVGPVLLGLTKTIVDVLVKERDESSSTV